MAYFWSLVVQQPHLQPPLPPLCGSRHQKRWCLDPPEPAPATVATSWQYVANPGSATDISWPFLEDKSINQSTNQPTNQLTNQPTNQPTNQSINQSINQINQSNRPMCSALFCFIGSRFHPESNHWAKSKNLSTSIDRRSSRQRLVHGIKVPLPTEGRRARKRRFLHTVRDFAYWFKVM